MATKDLVFKPATYETATHADGSQVYEWLSEHGYLNTPREDAIERRMREWRDGTSPQFDTVDRILLRAFDVYVRELPEDVWLRRA